MLPFLSETPSVRLSHRPEYAIGENEMEAKKDEKSTEACNIDAHDPGTHRISYRKNQTL